MQTISAIKSETEIFWNWNYLRLEFSETEFFQFFEIHFFYKELESRDRLKYYDMQFTSLKSYLGVFYFNEKWLEVDKNVKKSTEMPEKRKKCLLKYWL